MSPFEWWLNNAIGWLRFWLLPKVGQALLLWLLTWLIARWLNRCWRAWLHPALVIGRDRDAARAVWRQRQVLALPSVITNAILGVLAGWLTAELFGVPREALLWGIVVATLLLFWVGRYVLLDLAAGYALLLDDVLVPGDRLSLPFGEGMVERMTPFHVHLRLNDETLLVVPHRLLRGAPIKVQRIATQTVRR
ncbi:MAG: hypothetical protein PVTTEEND_001032 [Candidatus Fervidibacter sp.]|jgi:Small-conductance mechanosensitive channel